MNDATREKLIGILGAGVPPSAAALAAGVTPAYVTQLMEEESFRAKVVEASAARLDTAIAQDKTIESLKTKTLRVIENKLPFVRGPLEAARIYQILDSAKTNAPNNQNTNTTGGVTMVNIILPKAAGVALKLNSANQVIEVEGQTMATLPSRELPALRKRDEEKAQEVLEKTTPLNTVIGGVVRVL